MCTNLAVVQVSWVWCQCPGADIIPIKNLCITLVIIQFYCHYIYLSVSSPHILLSCDFISESFFEKLQINGVKIQYKSSVVWQDMELLLSFVCILTLVEKMKKRCQRM
jgi:hypothetical protein